MIVHSAIQQKPEGTSTAHKCEEGDQSKHGLNCRARNALAELGCVNKVKCIGRWSARIGYLQGGSSNSSGDVRFW